jgi:hypothetical protein
VGISQASCFNEGMEIIKKSAPFDLIYKFASLARLQKDE